MAQVSIWPGSGSAASGSTPFGFYDTDAQFQTQAPKFAEWSAKMMGYPLVDIELQDINFYACFEQAISEYSAQVNQINIRDNLLTMQGQPTSSNITQRIVTPTMGRTVALSEQYGTEAGVGGNVDWKDGSFYTTAYTQSYDLQDFAVVSESGAPIEIKRIFHDGTPAIARYFDPYAGTGAGSYNMLDNFGWGNMTPAVQFMMMPIYADLLRIQAIEFNDQVRKSAYSFELINNKLKLFPIPTSRFRVIFQYVLRSERDDPTRQPSGSDPSVISDYSNIPYNNLTYSSINSVGKQWILKYGLALVKEMLGMVRSKYQSLPIPNAEVNLDGETLRAEAIAEKEQLITELRETLEQVSRKTLMENDKEEAENLQEKLKNVPLLIFVG